MSPGPVKVFFTFSEKVLEIQENFAPETTGWTYHFGIGFIIKKPCMATKETEKRQTLHQMCSEPQQLARDRMASLKRDSFLQKGQHSDVRQGLEGPDRYSLPQTRHRMLMTGQQDSTEMAFCKKASILTSDRDWKGRTAAVCHRHGTRC